MVLAHGLIAPAEALAETELILNGSFLTGTKDWVLDRLDGTLAEVSVKEEDGRKVACVEVLETTTQPWNVNFFYPNLAIETGKTYHLKFRAKSETGGEVKVNLMENNVPWQSSWAQTITLEPDWKDFEFKISPSIAIENGRFTFGHLARQIGKYYFSDVSLTVAD